MGELSVYALGEIELVGAYVALGALLLSIVIWNRVRWWIRAIAIVVTLGFFFVQFNSIRHLMGWPTFDRLPDRFEMVYAAIMEPDQAAQEPGAIYLWIIPLAGSGALEEAEVYTPGMVDTRIEPGDMPRAFHLPYDRETHRSVYESQIKILEGVRQIGVTTRRPQKPGEDAPQAEFSLYDRPDPILPPKDYADE